MKAYKYLFIVLLALGTVNAQKIGELAPDKPPVDFPSNAWGVDLMFSDGGFGLGTFYRHTYSRKIIGFIDFSISESKDEREVEFVDYYTGLKITYGKKNRVLLMPLNFGIQYRLFDEVLTDSFRPYITAAAGPTMVFVAPYIDDTGETIEFFNSLKYGKMKFTVGGYVGFGANIGLSPKSLLGLSLRYYIIHLLDEGIENIEKTYRTDLSGIYIGINLGTRF